MDLLFFVELGSRRVHLAGFFMPLQRPQAASSIWPDTTYTKRRLRLVGRVSPDHIHRRDRLGGLIHEYAVAA